MIVDYLVRLGVGAGWVPRHLRLPLGHPRRTEMKQEMKQSLPKGTLELLILRGISRGPQSVQSVPRAQWRDPEPAPPSLQMPSDVAEEPWLPSPR